MDHPFVHILVFGLLIQTVQASQVLCAHGHYGGKCHKCPDNCSGCVSSMNCTRCLDGYYGLICDKPCKENCPRSCHKEYGFCPNGCLDGKYFALNDQTCQNCTENCEVCKSPSACFRCTVGKYGEICQHPCPVDNCVQCEKSNGECLQCKDSFFLVDGQCKSCPIGCRLCKTANYCLSCEDKFFGTTNGYCLLKCPDNNGSTYHLFKMTDRCTIVQDTDINTCDAYSGNYTCETSGYCLQNATCSKSVQCVANYTEQTSCVTDMQYTCDHECQKVYIFLLCNTTCSIRKKDSGYNISYCLGHDILSGFVEPFKKIYKGVCHRPKAERCIKGYMIDDVCHHKCPDNCLECVSNSNCTQCMDGFYGLICEIPCKDNCTRTCDKVNGYCRLKYSFTPNDPKYRESCKVKHCLRCEQSKGKCLLCKDTFFLVDEQCKRCPYGCRQCNTANNCLSCEDKFFGPINGSCLFKCPANDSHIYGNYRKNDQCRIVEDTDINTCDVRSDSYTCSTRGYCLQNTTCLNSTKCIADSTEQTSCVIEMHYNCHHECQNVYTFLVCNTTCNVRKRDSGSDIPFCLAVDSLSRINKLIKKVYTSDCNQTKDTIEKMQVNDANLELYIIIAVLVIIIVIGGISFVIYRYKKPHSDCSAAQSTHSVGDIEVAYNHRVGKLRRQTSHVSESGNPVSQCDTNASPDGDNNGALTEETPLNPENNHCSDQRDYKDIQKYPEYKCRSVSEPNKVLLRKLYN